jgi:uncharacterized protein (UPF0262 family)
MIQAAPSIETVTLDDASIIRRSPEVEHERRVALVDITHTNEVTLLGANLTPPYDLFISVKDNRLTLRFTESPSPHRGEDRRGGEQAPTSEILSNVSASNAPTPALPLRGREHDVTLPLMPYRGIIKDYFLMCEQYYDAIKHSASDRLQTLDMARRGVHNEGSEKLQRQLADKLTMDFATARRLFTLICVLHIK